MRQAPLSAVRVTIFILTLLLLRWIYTQVFSPGTNLICIAGAPLAVFPVVRVGRRLLCTEPTLDRLTWVTSVVHAIVMLLFGTAIIKAIQTSDSWQGLAIPIPRGIGFALVCVTTAFTLVTVVNLALRGLGAPFAIALSRRLATDWAYSRTRNPMVLAVLAWLLAMGLWLQSTLFLAWVLLLVTPAWVVFLKSFEELELEIRFGEAYRTYREETPFLWPRARRVGRVTQAADRADPPEREN